MLVEIPADVFGEDIGDELDYEPVPVSRSAPDPAAVQEAVEVLLNAERPVIYAGQGVHYARAWDALREFAELVEAPVTTSLEGKSAFPEDHPLSLGSGGRAVPQPVHEFIQEADVIFAIGASMTKTGFGIQLPAGKTYIHASLDSLDFNKEVVAQHLLMGDAKLTLEAMHSAASEQLNGTPRGRAAAIAESIADLRSSWLEDWAPKRNSDETPLNPYRVLRDLQDTVDVANTIITHDAGSPRDQLSPFWNPTEPMSYIGWGKTTQLGTGLGMAMGAKLARPDKLCINVWGDAAIGFTGMDFETAARERNPDSLDSAEQLLDGDRAADHEDRDGEVPFDRHLGQLRDDGRGVRGLRRTGFGAGRDRSGD